MHTELGGYNPEETQTYCVEQTGARFCVNLYHITSHGTIRVSYVRLQTKQSELNLYELNVTFLQIYN